MSPTLSPSLFNSMNRFRCVDHTLSTLSLGRLRFWVHQLVSLTVGSRFFMSFQFILLCTFSYINRHSMTADGTLPNSRHLCPLLLYLRHPLTTTLSLLSPLVSVSPCAPEALNSKTWSPLPLRTYLLSRRSLPLVSPDPSTPGSSLLNRR